MTPSQDLALPIKQVQSEKRRAMGALLYKTSGYRLIGMKELGIPGTLTDRVCLEKWIAGEDGFFKMILKCEDGGYHVVFWAKDKDTVFCWDPTIGLIEHPKMGAVDAFTKFFRRFWGDSNNHQFDFCKLESD